VETLTFRICAGRSGRSGARESW